ncbi:MAG: di-heme oxidoredictase family protein, partial [Myxococcota bacterium]
GISPLARAPPTLVGLGLLEAVAEETIAARADPDDRDGDGISGRMSRVAAGQQLGRFGWKAQQATLSSQVAAALSEDMGITTRQHPYAGCAPKDKACRGAVDASGRPEMTDQDFDRLIAYLRSVAPPAPRPETPSSRRGEALFVAAGCEACHRTTLVTPSVVDDAFPHGVAQQRIYPFTDLLLHDMGPGLADGESTGSTAAPGEWRTAPLWGLGLLKTVNGTMQLLHDGRARTFEEAILWHGGEAAGAQARYTRLSKAERNDLNAFLQRL